MSYCASVGKRCVLLLRFYRLHRERTPARNTNTVLSRYTIFWVKLSVQYWQTRAIVPTYGTRIFNVKLSYYLFCLRYTTLRVQTYHYACKCTTVASLCVHSTKCTIVVRCNVRRLYVVDRRKRRTDLEKKGLVKKNLIQILCVK